MEYIYATLLLNKCGKEVNEENIRKILTAVNIKADDSKIKALVSALKDINIEEAIKEAAITPIVAPISEQKTKKNEEPVEEKKDAEEAAAGLGALFS